MSARRGSARAARARQAALYLAHIGFGLTYSTVGRAFGRDRTTVRHACARIEDAREDRGLDLGLGHLEQATLSLHSAIAAMTALDHGAISPTTPKPWRLA
jgi:hypothetical protein